MDDNKVVDSITEKYLKRFYKVHIVKTTFFVALVVFILFKSITSYFEELYPNDHIALINIAGTIATGNPEGSGLKISEALTRAFENDSAKVVLLVMNSGGGSPAQAEMTYDTINMLKAKYDKPIITSMADICASACYFIASATDTIYAHRSTITGSIGVRMDTWGFKDIIQKVGVERRTITTGPFKSILDPYQDMKESDKDIIRKNALTPMYRVFIDSVKKGRGEKLKTEDDELFNGLFWTGDQAVELGLVDTIKATPVIVQELKTKYGVDKLSRYNGRRLSVMQMVTSSVEDVIDSIASKGNQVQFY